MTRVGSLVVLLTTRAVVAMPPPHGESAGITCADCHANHVRERNEYDTQAMCQTCHNPTGMAASMPDVAVHAAADGTVIGCGACHDPHNLEANSGQGAALIRETVRFFAARDPVLYPAPSNPLIVGGAPYNGVCETCHTQTTHHRNSANGDHAHHVDEDCLSCHPHGRGFVFDHTSVVLPAPTCGICHVGPDPVAGVHHSNCDLCHVDPSGGGPLREPWETTHPSGGTCLDCHGQVSGDHEEVTHLATPGSGNVIVFADDDHDDAGWVGEPPYFDVFASCELCHVSNLRAAHANRCVTCHPTPYDTLVSWNGTCQDSGCHPTIHGEAPTAHVPFADTSDPDNDCDRCHEPAIGPVVAENCAHCHATPGGADTTPPVTTSDVQASYIGAAWINFILTDNGGVGVGTTFYRLDGAEPSVGPRVLVSSVGDHVLEFWSIDQAGNIESPANSATCTIVEDTTAPETTSDARASYYQGALITLTATDASSEGVRATYFSVNGGPPQMGTRVVLPATTGVIAYTLEFWSDDWSGNVETPHSASFTVTSGTGTIRLVWGDSDSNGPPTDPDASANWTIRLGGPSGTLVASGSGANPGWSGVDDEIVPVRAMPYYVDIWWWDSTYGWDDNTVYPEVYLSAPGDLVRLSY